MNRRSVLKSLGATTIAGSAVLGSGALTQVTAQRNVSINVTNDSSSAVEMSAGTAASGGFADISEGSDGTLGFSTADINEGGQLIVGDATGNDPTSNTISSAAFELGIGSDNNWSLGTDTAMGIEVKVKNASDNTSSGLGLLFLPKSGDSATDKDLINAAADGSGGGKSYASTSDRQTVAGKGLSAGGSGTFPKIPDRYSGSTSGTTARFLLEPSQVSTVGGEMLIQANSGETDVSGASFNITVTAETVDISTS